MDHNINSGEDYARLLTETISQADGPLPEQLVEYWCEDIWEMAVNSYNDYIAGKKDDYLLSDVDMNEAYDRAGIKYTQEILNGLVDKGMVQAGVGEEGEILYSLTEEGKKHTL
jgi:hypothetical protein